jgi:hypothetical protein
MLSENGQDVPAGQVQVTRQPINMFLIKIVAWVQQLQVRKHFVFQDVDNVGYIILI